MVLEGTSPELVEKYAAIIDAIYGVGEEVTNPFLSRIGFGLKTKVLTDEAGGLNVDTGAYMDGVGFELVPEKGDDPDNLR